ncbi:MAG: penicillin-binding transpeptidase domain-containing protein [Anaerolineae bacterium]
MARQLKNVFDLNDIFYCARSTWDGRQFGDTFPQRFDWRNFEVEDANFDTGDVTMSEALAASCNPFFYQMGALLFRDRGPSTLTQYAQGMGLGQRTGFDFTDPREVAGQLETPQGADAAISQAIGQGNSQVTILQMARMVAAVANGGTLYEPYIVESVGNSSGELDYEATPDVAGQIPLSERALTVVQDGMCMVPDSTVYGRSSGARLGTAWFAFSDPDWYPAPYTLCGKTGTAQTGRIEPNGWFVAYAPADNPQIAVAAMIEHGREGSKRRPRIVRRILDAYFTCRGIRSRRSPNGGMRTSTTRCRSLKAAPAFSMDAACVSSPRNPCVAWIGDERYAVHSPSLRSGVRFRG